ncbi:hypothetical protein [uncultured Methylobacterium sp.]|jgi:hypothetical protein|uniref:hypothetical protein n=1 Tax=uncultured Methylobacterium sp. TaxID=157278 RepID=UPI00261FC889|nr:hypothetical protein [uncultured Methylobacterium sp.]
MAPLFFLHVPRSGGASLCHAAGLAFPADRIFLLYGKDDASTHPFAREVMACHDDVPVGERLRLISDYVSGTGVAFYASHLSAGHLPCFDPRRAVTLLRRPYDRVLSHYASARAQGRTDLSLEAFIEDPRNQNVQARALGPVDPDALAVVGVLDDYPAFVGRLNRMFGLDLAVIHRNRGNPPAATHSPALRAYVERLNASDMDLYRRAAAHA